MLEVTEVHLHLEVTSGMGCANAVDSGCNKRLPTRQEEACICKIKQSCLNHEQRCFKRQWLVLPVQTLRRDISVTASEQACVSASRKLLQSLGWCWQQAELWELGG